MDLVNDRSDRRWADRIADMILGRLAPAPGLRLCLPTGLTPMPVYDRLAAAVARGAATFAHAEVFLLDEFGGVPADDPGRCDQMLARGLVSRVDLAPGRFHRFTLDGDVDEECRRYESLIGAGCDLALLGIGTNGHVGMNEPGSTPDTLTRRVDLAPSTIEASARYFGRIDRAADVGRHPRPRHAAPLARGLGAGEAAPARRPSSPTRSTVRCHPTCPPRSCADHPAALLIADDAASRARVSGRATTGPPC